MDRITRKARTLALLACSLSGATAVQAADVSGKLSYSYNFKPQFYPGDGPGNYHLLLGSATLKDEATSYRLMTYVFATNTPEREVQVVDPSATVSHTIPLAEGGPSLAGLVGYTYEATHVGRDSGYRGALRAGLSLAQSFAGLDLSAGAGLKRHFNRYTLGADGSPLAVSTTSATFIVGYALTSTLSAEVSLAYAKTRRYAGADTASYQNAAGIGYAATDKLTLEAGVTTSDAQLRSDGSGNNEFTFYKRNQTEGSVGFTYAL